MENLAIIESFGEFKDEKSIDRVTLMTFIEEAFRVQIRKKYLTDDNFDVIVNPDKGDLEIWRNRTIVADGAVEDENLEIALSEAIKIEPDFEVGEEVSEEIKIIDLGRRSFWPFAKPWCRRCRSMIRASCSSATRLWRARLSPEKCTTCATGR